MTDTTAAGIKDWTLCFLGVGIVAGFFFINWLILTGAIVPDNDTNVTTILNYTNSLVIFVAGFFFGASKSNTDKDKAVADMAAAAVANTGTGNGASTTTTTMPDGTTVKTGPAVKPTEGPIEVVNAENTTLKTETEPQKVV